MSAQTFKRVADGIAQRGTESFTARTWRGGPSKTFTGKGAKAQAIAWRREVMGKRDKGETVLPTRVSRVTILSECERWLAAYETAVEPSTLESYRSRAANLIAPTLGGRYCHEATKGNVDAWIAQLVREGNAPLVINQAKSLLARVMDDAVERGIMTTHGVRKARGVKGAHAAPEYVPAPERAEVDAITDEIRPYRRLVCLLALGAGLRVGEALGVRPEDVREDEDGYWWLHVDRQYAKGGRFTLPKGRKTRRVPIKASLVMALRTHEATYGLSTAGTYVQGVDGGPLAHRTWEGEWDRAREATGVSLRGVHTLRHAFGSYLVAAGESLANVQVWMGHASMATTMAYYVRPVRDARPGVDTLERPASIAATRRLAH